MTGSIGQLAEQVLNEVKQNALVKVAQCQIVKEASNRPNPKTEVGKLLHKLANDIRQESDDVTIGDMQQFLTEANYDS